jgi:predicted thioesterase
LKQTLSIGYRAEFTFEVRSEMTVVFEGRALHPFYSTYWMAYHAEYVSRLVLEPHLELDKENGVGTGLTIKHHAPVGVGTVVTFTAECTELRGSYLACKFEARTADGMLIGSGDVHQVVVPNARLDELKRIAANRDMLA